ncbi:hypothetical protein HID58_014407 [Brassica napus]|uniref:Uncharacterized protein n=1 Tax=Brassica napus TaxID=3708 RepID=A0ABQ8DH28_BRANA|nr:hypothetical protein HID58_014407 [Brassica napus]
MRRRGSDLAFGFGSLENRSGGMDVRLLSDGSWWWWSRSGSDLDFGGGFSLFLCLLVLSSRLGRSVSRGFVGVAIGSSQVGLLRVLRSGGACEEASRWTCQPRLFFSVVARAGLQVSGA